MGNEGSIICKQKICYQLLMGLGVSLQSSKIEEVAIKAVPDIYKLFVIEVLSGLFQHHTEEEGEKGWCQDTALLHPVGYGEWF